MVHFSQGTDAGNTRGHETILKVEQHFHPYITDVDELIKELKERNSIKIKAEVIPEFKLNPNQSTEMIEFAPSRLCTRKLSPTIQPWVTGTPRHWTTTPIPYSRLTLGEHAHRKSAKI